MELRDGDLLLRPVERRDAEALAAACDDEEIARFVPLMPSPYTRADADEWVERCAKVWRTGESFPFAIVDAESDALLGSIELRTAVVEDGVANWPYRERPQLASPDGLIRLQFCCGAPGIVATASEYLTEELLVAGAELAWRAGPPGMDKGPCICQGTAGTGHAFLKAFARTGDERWLERARRFAMHALGQVERRGRGRHSLWTGDIGVALFAADCIDGHSELPVFDTL